MAHSKNISVNVGTNTFSLKNIEVYERMSDETTAFVADLYVGKIKVGTCENSGKGEGNYPCVYGAFERGLMEIVEKEVSKHHFHEDNYYGHTLDWDYSIDFLIAEMVAYAWELGHKTYKFSDER